MRSPALVLAAALVLSAGSAGAQPRVLFEGAAARVPKPGWARLVQLYRCVGPP